MAILDIYEVSLATPAGPVIEFDDPDFDSGGGNTQNGFKVARYLKVEENTRFNVNLKMGPGFKFGTDEFIYASIFLDGTKITAPVIDPESYRAQREHFSTSREGSYEGSGATWTFRKFVFGSLPIVEELVQEQGVGIRSNHAELGEIRVEFWRCRGSPKCGRDAFLQPNILQGGDVPEKALKGRAISLSAKLGPAEPARAPEVWAGQDLEKLVSFIFKYRSEEALKQLGIIERDPSLQELKCLKRERGDDDDGGLGGGAGGGGGGGGGGNEELTVIKTPNKKRRLGPAKVVDLSTED